MIKNYLYVSMSYVYVYVCIFTRNWFFKNYPLIMNWFFKKYSLYLTRHSRIVSINLFISQETQDLIAGNYPDDR